MNSPEHSQQVDIYLQFARITKPLIYSRVEWNCCPESRGHIHYILQVNFMEKSIGPLRLLRCFKIFNIIIVLWIRSCKNLAYKKQIHKRHDVFSFHTEKIQSKPKFVKPRDNLGSLLICQMFGAGARNVRTGRRFWVLAQWLTRGTWINFTARCLIDCMFTLCKEENETELNLTGMNTAGVKIFIFLIQVFSIPLSQVYVI